MKYFFTIVLSIPFGSARAQNNIGQTLPKALIPHGHHKTVAGKDTVIESDTSKENKEPRYYYISALTNIYVNTHGGFAKRFAPAVEFGRTYGIFDIGLATGRLSSLGRDTAQYVEFRPTINIFSAGRFAEGLCLGAGYIFQAKQQLMTEICNSINFNISTRVAVAVTQGYVFFDGTNNSRTGQYMGFSFTYNFLRSHSVNHQRKKSAITKDN